MAEQDAGPDNRRDRRFSIRVPIYVALGGEVVRKTVHLESRDVSAGGISFETSRELPLQAESQVVLARMGVDDGAVSIRGRVVWTRAIEATGRYLVGVQFTEYGGLSREELAARIEELASSR
jgi:c-di-GMP-binding flagellar brake protein YcgR